MENYPKISNSGSKGISIDILREAPPDKLTLPPEPIYEEDVDNRLKVNAIGELEQTIKKYIVE